jgi:hypothetical protein
MKGFTGGNNSEMVSDLARVFTTYQKDDRVVMPLFKTFELLFSRDLLASALTKHRYISRSKKVII